MSRMGIQILDEQLVQQIERIAHRERRRELDLIAQAVRLYDQQTQGAGMSSFLLAIAGLGSSSQGDVAEGDEEILAAEIDRVQGWGSSGDGA
jgi:hypothetical protein